MPITKEARDKLLGKKLSVTIAGTAVEEPCPDLEKIAALVDQRLSADERDRLMKHLAGCSDCYQLYTLTAEMAKPEKRTTSQSLVVLTGSIAAVLVAVFGFILSNRPPEQQIALQYPALNKAPSVTAMAPAPPALVSRPDISKTEQAKRTEDPLTAVVLKMAGTLPKDVSLTPVTIDKSLGFASQPDTNHDSLSMGRNLFLLEICLARNDRSAALNLLTQISQMAERLELPAETQAYLKKLSNDIYTGKGIKRARGKGFRTVSSALENEAASRLILGAWLQGSIMAAQAEQPAYFASSYFTRTAAYLSDDRFPAETSSLIKELADLGQHTPLKEKEYLQIELAGKLIAGD